MVFAAKRWVRVWSFGFAGGGLGLNLNPKTLNPYNLLLDSESQGRSASAAA